MPIIIDANRCGDFDGRRDVAKVIANQISKKRIKLTVCNALLRELVRTRIRRLLLTWDQVGMLIRLDDDAYRDALNFINGVQFSSNDPHILALAYGTGCRLLYTEDGNLITDFKNPSILQPKGKVMKPDTSLRIVRALLGKHSD